MRNRFGHRAHAVRARIGQRDAGLAVAGDDIDRIVGGVAGAAQVAAPSQLAALRGLEQRMRHRGQDSEAVIAQRLAAAREEMSHYGEFDYVIVNEVFDTAVDEICAIFTASRLRRGQQQLRQAALLQGLLGE